MHRFISQLSILFHWYMCLFCVWQYHTILITVDLLYSLNSGSVIPSALFFLQIVSVIRVLLCFCTNFKISCSSSIDILIRNVLGIHTEETRSERDMCTPMFITALFIIARTWKQPRCPSADECIRKLWYIYIMEYYSVVKKNSFESILMSWMKLEPIIQSEVSQKDKDQCSILMHIYGI